MNLSQWDQETKCIGSQLDSVYQRYLSTHSIQKRVLLNIKNSIINLQGQLSINIERLSHAVKRKPMLPPRQRSLVHWAGIYAENAQRFYSKKIEVLGKNLWLQLIRSRMPGMSHAHGLPFTDEHLVEISLRYRQLKEIEHQLKNEIHALNTQKQELIHQYNDQKTISANRESANTLNLSFGRNPQDSLKHPILIRIKSVLQRIFQAGNLNPQFSYLREQQRNADKLSKKVLQDCRTLVLQDLETPNQQPSPSTITHYQQSLTRIQELEQQLLDANRLLSQNPPPIHPILVKNS